MATMQALLEKDKERFLHNAAAAKSSAETVHAVQEELSRLLTLYNEEENSARIKEMALAMIESIRTSAGFLDCDGASIIWSKSEYRPGFEKPKKSAWFWILLAAGILLACGSAAILILLTDMVPPSQNMVIGIAMMCAAMISLFASGMISSRSKKKNDEELYAETIPDAEKTYHILLASAVSMDRTLNLIRSEETLLNKQALLDEKEGMKKEDVQLLSGLLESAYAERDNDYAKEVISEVKFYLHKKQIDVIDYNGENKALFERMPGGKGTIRPALVIANTVIRKGLAAGE